MLSYLERGRRKGNGDYCFGMWQDWGIKIEISGKGWRNGR